MFWKHFWLGSQRDNLVVASLLLVVSLGLGYKIHLLRFDSKLRKTALQILTVHSSYNQFLRDNNITTLGSMWKTGDDGVFLSENVIYRDRNETGISTSFWTNFFNSENSRKLILQLKQNKISVAHMPLNSFGDLVELYISRDEQMQDSDQLIIGLVVSDRHGYMLDNLIDDASPTGGNIQLKGIISDENNFSQTTDCPQVELVGKLVKDAVACNYVYLF